MNYRESRKDNKKKKKIRRYSFYFSYYSKFMNLLHNHFLQIYVLFLYTYGKTNESEKTVRL
jgi:hypothetical protein